MECLQYNFEVKVAELFERVLNLVINGMPSIHKRFKSHVAMYDNEVLNLVINGMPSILMVG